MAKIKDGILGGFSGKIGNIVGVRNPDGSFTIRSKRGVVNNPKSPAQQAGRSGFGMCASLFKIVQPFVEHSLRHVDGKKARGAFISLNSRSVMSGVYPDLYLDYRYLKVADGSLLPAANPKAVWNDEGSLAFSWSNNSGEGGARASDRVMLLVINPAKRHIDYIVRGNTRAEGGDVLVILPENRHDELHGYIAFIADNGSIISSSVYVAL